MKLGFVVEGFHDEEQLKKVFNEVDVDIVIIRGTRISGRIKKEIAELHKRVDLMFIATDPDFEGNQFYDRIQKFFDFELKRLELDPEKCIGMRNHKKKIGLEYMSVNDLAKTIARQITI